MKKQIQKVIPIFFVTKSDFPVYNIVKRFTGFPLKAGFKVQGKISITNSFAAIS